MTYTVIDHHHNKGEGVYRITVGLPEEIQFTKLDNQGNPVMTPGQPLIGLDGEPLIDENGNPVIGSPTPEIVTTTIYHHVEDFVFADDDRRWSGLAVDDVVVEQREIVKQALDEHQVEQDRNKVPLKQLPGVGEEL